MNTIYDKQYWTMPCERHSCRKAVEGLMFVFIPATLGDDGATSKVAPKKGTYSNAIVEYEANGAVYIYSAEGIPANVKEGGGGGEPSTGIQFITSDNKRLLTSDNANFILKEEE